MKIRIEPTETPSTEKEVPINSMDYGIYLVNLPNQYGGWKLCLVCYDSEVGKRLVKLENPSEAWSGCDFVFRPAPKQFTVTIS